MSVASTAPVEMRGLQGMANRECLNAEISTGRSTGTAQQQSDSLRASALKTVPRRVKQKASQFTAQTSRPVVFCCTWVFSAISVHPQCIGVALCWDVICDQGRAVHAVGIGDLPVGPGTMGLQCGEQGIYPLSDYFCADGSSYDSKDQTTQKALIPTALSTLR